MSTAPTTLPACTYEDGSEPGQVFPCRWDSTLYGDGHGKSFVMPALDTYVYDDGVVLCPANAWINATADGCEPLPANAPPSQVVALEPVPAYTDVPLTAPVPAAAATLTAPAAPPAQLAATGADPILWVAAALMIAGGAALARVARRA